MALTGGVHELGPRHGRLLVKTRRAGLGAKMGHDLTIEATRWEGSATVDPDDPANSLVTVTVDADSLEVREGTGGVKPLTDSDRADIQRITREKILHTGRYPKIAFRSTRVAGTEQSFTIEGDLTIMGVTRPVTVRAAVSDDERIHGTATVVQSRWGIKPYSAFLGALRLSDDVTVEFAVALPPG